MINWKEIPFVRFFFPFAAGISLATFLENNHPIWYGLLLCFVIVRLVLAFKKVSFQFRWVHGFIAYSIIFLVGYLWCFHFNELQSETHFNQQLSTENILIGKISNTPKVGNYLKASLSTHQIGRSPDSLKNCDGNLLVYLKNDSTSQLNYGDIIAFKGRIQKVEPPKNPHAFDYQRYLHFQNIHYQVFVNKPENWKLLATEQGDFVQKNTIEIREYFLGVLEKYLTTPNELAVGNALILGYKDDLDEEVRSAYAHTGALHVLAVSGLHVGLVAFFVNILLSLVKSRTWTWRMSKAIILIGTIWAFALITGGSPSVLRAATMFMFLIIGLSVNRTTNIYNSLAISAVFLLVWNPYLLFNVSFQLSYFAILGIIFFTPKIYSSVFFKNSFLRRAWQLMSVTFGAQIGTLPISIYYFHSFPFLAWMSGVVVIPAATVILGSGLLLLFVHSVIPTLAFIPATILYYSIWSMNQVIFFIQKIPLSVVVGLWIGIGTVILLYAIIGNIVLVFTTKNMRWLLPAGGLFLLISINYSFTSFGEIHQRKLFIYHSYKNTIIDFFDGKNGWSFSNGNIEEKNLSFTTQNNRWAHGIKKNEQFNFTSDDFLNQNVFFQKPFLQFFDKKILVIDEHFQFRNHAKINVDFILIRNKPNLNIEDVSTYFLFEKIIFDASNPKWKVDKWKTDCQKLNIPYYDILENGAFEISLE